jgi:hypothetical protein
MILVLNHPPQLSGNRRKMRGDGETEGLGEMLLQIPPGKGWGGFLN